MPGNKCINKYKVSELTSQPWSLSSDFCPHLPEEYQDSWLESNFGVLLSGTAGSCATGVRTKELCHLRSLPNSESSAYHLQESNKSFQSENGP